MNHTTQEVIEFYNEFANYQKKSGINDRHFQLLNWLKKFGLKSNHSVLEVGCGSGQLTQLIAEYCKKGQIRGLDISPGNINMAVQRLAKHRHVQVVVSDVTKELIQGSYDMIILPDVMEHIPLEFHHVVFQAISNVLKKDGKLLIHIPHPRYLDFLRINEPEKLQIIDQSLSAGRLITEAESAGFHMVYFKSYSLHFVPADYQIIVFESKDRSFQPHLKPYLRRVLLKIRLRGLRK
jgi:cyclopropane fatty-acyl-phospholipid synthase-like methyltransferase